MGKKGDATKQQICAAAYTLFAEKGYQKVTMQEICSKSGLSKGGLYRHYEEKSQIFADILKMLQQQEAAAEKGGMTQGRSAGEILEDYLAHIRQDLRKDVPHIDFALYEFCMEGKEGTGPAVLAGQFKRGMNILLSLIDYGSATGEFRVTEPRGAAAAVLFLVEGLRMANEVMPVAEETLTEVLEQIRILLGWRKNEKAQAL